MQTVNTNTMLFLLHVKNLNFTLGITCFGGTEAPVYHESQQESDLSVEGWQAHRKHWKNAKYNSFCDNRHFGTTTH